MKGEPAASIAATMTAVFGTAAGAEDLKRVDPPADRPKSFKNDAGNARIMNPDQAVRLFAN